MDLVAYLSLLIILTTLLVRSADLIEDVFVLIARKLGVSSFLIGFAVLGVVSTIPEISIVISSSINQRPGLSIGNLLGGTFLLLTLVLALNAYIHKKIPFKGSFGTHQVILAMVLILGQIVVLLDGELGALEGMLLIVAYCAYVVYIALRVNHIHHTDLHEEAKIEVGKLTVLILKALAGVVGLLLFSKWIVDAAIVVAEMLQVPGSIVGLLILALGTNIPELTILLRSRSKDQEKLAVGNFVGSAVVNVAVLGLLGVLKPHEIVEFNSLIPILVYLLIAVIIFGYFSWSGEKLTRREGTILLGIYGAMIATEILILVQGLNH